MKSYYSAAALARLRLPGLPSTESGMKRCAKRGCWRFRERVGNGGGIEYAVSSLPDEARSELMSRLVAEAPAPATAPTIAAASPSNAVAAAGVPAKAAAGAVARASAARDVAAAHGWQRDCGYAREALLARVGQLVATLDISIKEALCALNESLSNGSAPELEALARRANARLRKSGPVQVDRATYFNWKSRYEAGGLAELMPKETHCERTPDWAPYLFNLNTTNKLNKTHLHEQLVAVLRDPGTGYDGKVPSLSTVGRFIDNKVGVVAWESGRRGPRDMKNVKPYTKRLSPKYPDDVYLSDGHTFDAFVAHWDGRGKLKPEITPVISASTRKIVGISFGAHEDTRGVLEAQRRAFTTHGVCAIWYVDNGPGFKNDAQHHEMVGIAARVGFEISHSIPYNSQARGLIERAHQTIFVRAAKELPTYIGKSADREAYDRVHRIDLKKVKQLKRGPVLPTWAEFVAFILKKVDEYNARSHKGLVEKVVWPDGKRRSPSPNMAWEAAKAKGWTPRLLSEDEARTLFRPRELRVVDRGVIRFDNKQYSSKALTEYHGLRVWIGYDWCDPSFLTVEEEKTKRWICDAHLDANARPFFPESVLESTRRKSGEAMLRRAQNRVDRLAEEIGQPAIEHAPSPKFDWDAIDVEPVEKVAVEAAPARKFFQFDSERYEWLMERRADWTEEDRAFVRHYTGTETYALLREDYEARGMAWMEDKGKGFSAAG